ncbi:hypothetical protein C8Q80DRAFT_1054009, partial [Daedaleopsis nitida]
SRGIGVGITKQLLEPPANLKFIATARDPARATALQDLKSTAKGPSHVITLDVDQDDGILRSYEEVRAILGDRGLNYLVNNAAI